MREVIREESSQAWLVTSSNACSRSSQERSATLQRVGSMIGPVLSVLTVCTRGMGASESYSSIEIPGLMQAACGNCLSAASA